MQQTFDRYEKKYLLTPEQARFLQARLTPYFREDQYGLHTICSVYYDTEDFAVIRQSCDKPVYKEKLRLRSYTSFGAPAPGPDSPVFLELKKKFDGVVNKRRVSLTLQQARDYLSGGTLPPKEIAESQIFREIDWFVRRWQPCKAVLVAYDRIALQGLTEAAPRMTLDRNIRWRTELPDPAYGSDGQLLWPEQESPVLMEVKVPGAVPVWLAHLLDEAGVYPASFSKIGSIYTAHLNPFDPQIRRNIPCSKASCPSPRPAASPRSAS